MESQKIEGFIFHAVYVFMDHATIQKLVGILPRPACAHPLTVALLINIVSRHQIDDVLILLQY
jgi:hypothetical protein